MLRLNASYSKKIPVGGEDYSSQQYHASVEVELPDGLEGERLRQRIHDTFELVRDSVERELHGGQRGHAGPVSAPKQPEGAKGERRERPASPKQIQYLIDLAVRQKMTMQELDAEAQRVCGAGDIGSLSRSQASGLIDRLNGNSGRERRAA
jgi:hypothetical protein